MVLLGTHSYHCGRAPLFKLNNKWMVRNKKDGKKVLVLICDNNINYMKPDLICFFLQAMQLFYAGKIRFIDDRVIGIIPLFIQDKNFISVF